jgi:hypothetical protein
MGEQLVLTSYTNQEDGLRGRRLALVPYFLSIHMV